MDLVDDDGPLARPPAYLVVDARQHGVVKERAAALRHLAEVEEHDALGQSQVEVCRHVEALRIITIDIQPLNLLNQPQRRLAQIALPTPPAVYPAAARTRQPRSGRHQRRCDRFLGDLAQPVAEGIQRRRQAVVGHQLPTPVVVVVGQLQRPAQGGDLGVGKAPPAVAERVQQQAEQRNHMVVLVGRLLVDNVENVQPRLRVADAVVRDAL